MGITAQSSSGQNTHTKVFLVTGATGAIGKAIARQLANIQDSQVVLVCRDQQKAVLAANEIRSLTGNSEVSYELADLSRYEQIRDLAKRWQGPLHALINNAACTPRSRQETPEGLNYW
jgi:retinol dehydrogenase-13